MPAARWGRSPFSAGDGLPARPLAISEVMRMSLTMSPQFTKIVTRITRSMTPIKQDLCNLKEVASPAGDHQIFKKN
jgi:hypothetical protein